MLRRSVLLLLLLLCGGLCAQVPVAYRPLVQGKPLKVQVAILDSLATTKKKDQPDEAEKLLRLAVSFALTGGDDSLAAKERLTLGRFYRTIGKNDAAVASLDSTITFAKEKGLLKILAYAYNHKGLALTRAGDFPNASKAFFDGIAVAEKLRDTTALAMLKQHCGSMYFYTRDYDKAIFYTQQSLELFEHRKDSVSIASNLDNIGLYYSNKQQYDSAYKYELRALEMFRQLGDSTQLIVSYNNIGALLTNTKRYGEAEQFIRQSLAMAERRKDNFRVLTAVFSLGNLYVTQNQNEKAIAEYKRAYDLSVGLQDDYHTKESAGELGELYYLEKDFANAAFYLRISSDLKSKLYDEEKAKAIDEVSQKYETAQRQKQIELLEAKNAASGARIQRDRLLRIIFISAGVVLLVFLFIMIARYIRKQRDNRILQEKNDAIAAQKKLIEEKNHEIVDSINYATRIQNAVLPSPDRLHSLFPQSFVYFRPRDIISGDFFWITGGAGDKRYLAVADCTGHGVPGALMSMLGSSLLNQVFSKENDPRPGPLLDRLHDQLIRMLNESTETRSVNDGMDITLLLHDPVKKKVVIASAARPVYIWQDHAFRSITPDKISIGSTLPKNAPYTETEIDVSVPVQLYLFSDGITDQFGGPEAKKFMSKRLRELIADHANKSITERERVFAEAFESWKAGHEQTDDMTLIHLII